MEGPQGPASRPVLIGRHKHTHPTPHKRRGAPQTCCSRPLYGPQDQPTPHTRTTHTMRCARGRANHNTTPHTYALDNTRADCGSTQPHTDVSVVTAGEPRPAPSRTRKLRPPAPMVLHPPGCGRVGHRRAPTTQQEPVHPPRVNRLSLYTHTPTTQPHNGGAREQTRHHHSQSTNEPPHTTPPLQDTTTPLPGHHPQTPPTQARRRKRGDAPHSGRVDRAHPQPIEPRAGEGLPQPSPKPGTPPAGPPLRPRTTCLRQDNHLDAHTLS